MRVSIARIFVWVTITLGVAALLRWAPRPDGRVRWFMPGPLGREVVRTASPPGQARLGFNTRAFSGLNDRDAQEWGQRNGLTRPLNFSHNLAGIFPRELHRTHPEYFPLADGKRLEPPPRSHFWNPDIARPDVARHAAAATRRFFDAHPDEPSFALGVNDGLIWGESPELLALATPPRWFRERPDYSNVVFTFMNRVAAELAATHPHKYVGALAYYWCENTPDFAVHPQVIPFLTADRSQGYDPAFKQEEFALQQQWGRLAGRAGPSAPGAPPRRLGIYDYVYGHGFLIPRIHTRLLAEHLRHAWRAGFTDYFAEVNPNWGLDGPQPWLLAQLLQDPEQDAAALLDEYYGSYFRECAEPMRRFFERCEEQWMRQPGPQYWLKHYRNESQAIVFPSVICAELRALLDAARARAVSPTVRARVRLVSEAFGVTERYVAFHEARDRLARLSLTEPADTEAGRRALSDMLATRREFVRHTSALRRAQPLALAPFNWNDFIRYDPVPQALEALQRARSPFPIEQLREEPRVSDLWMRLATAQNPVELLRDSAMVGNLRPARMIAGLPFGVALPAEWSSQVEPAEFHRVELTGPAEERRLRFMGSKATTVQQWVPRTAPGLHRAAVRVRGKVSPSTVVSLVLAWLDENHRHLGIRTVRLPDGEWPEWVTLRQADLPPARAAWVGLGLQVHNQVGDDWIEATGFSVSARP